MQSDSAGTGSEIAAEGVVVEVRCRLDDPVVAQSLVDHLVGQRFAACGHVEPAAPARYWWQGDFVRDHEVEVRCLTSPSASAALVAELRSRHPYQLPGITWASVGTTVEFAAWVQQETAQRA